MPQGLVTGQRDRRVDRYGSPLFPTRNSAAITAGASWAVDYEAVTSARKYLPLDWIQFKNKSTESIGIYLDGGTTRHLGIPGGVIETIVDRPFVRLRIVNEDGAAQIEANEIEIVAQRRPKNADDLARQEMTNPLRGLGGLLGLGRALMGV